MLSKASANVFQVTIGAEEGSPSLDLFTQIPGRMNDSFYEILILWPLISGLGPRGKMGKNQKQIWATLYQKYIFG